MSQSPVQKPSLKPQTASNAGVEAPEVCVCVCVLKHMLSQPPVHK